MWHLDGGPIHAHSAALPWLIVTHPQQFSMFSVSSSSATEAVPVSAAADD